MWFDCYTCLRNIYISPLYKMFQDHRVLNGGITALHWAYFSNCFISIIYSVNILLVPLVPHIQFFNYNLGYMDIPCAIWDLSLKTLQSFWFLSVYYYTCLKKVSMYLTWTKIRTSVHIHIVIYIITENSKLIYIT